jgi:hypothetical protein
MRLSCADSGKGGKGGGCRPRVGGGPFFHKPTGCIRGQMGPRLRGDDKWLFALGEIGVDYIIGFARR